MLQLLTSIQVALAHAAARLRARARARGEAGQSTAEYALVLLGASAVALLVVAWATKTNKITDLLDGVVDKVLDQVK